MRYARSDRALWGIIGCLILSLPLQPAAHELNFQHFLVPDGLPQTQVQAIHQDADGYIWVGTYGGAGRYNGRTFTVFTRNDGLAANTIFSIDSTPDGRVWMGTNNGVCWKARAQARFECSAAPELAGTTVRELQPDDAGVWVGTNRGLFQLDPTTPHELAAAYLAGHDVTALERNAEGELLIGTRSGLFRLDRDGPTAVALPDVAGAVVLSLQRDNAFVWIGTERGLFLQRGDTIRPSPGLPEGWRQDNVNAMTRSPSNDVWIATNQGVLRHTRDGFDLLNEASGMMSNINFSIFADREGVIWIGNDNGLSKYSPGPFVGYRNRHGLLHYFVRSLSEDLDGNLWLGTRVGAQRVPYRDGQWRFTESRTVTVADGLTDPRIYSIAFPARGEALFATGDGVVHWRDDEGIVRHYNVNDGLPSSQTRSLHVDDDGLVWIGTTHGLVTLRDGVIRPATDARLAKAPVLRIRADTGGRLWFATQKPGLLRYANGEVTEFGAAEGLTDTTIWDIAPDQQGGVWVGSNGAGLFHVQADDDIRQFTTEHGLVNDFVWQVLVDNQDRVWTYTNNGISRYADGEFRNYNRDDGLLHLEGGATGALQTHDGALWFASGDGLARYMPQFETESTLPPPVLIERVTVGGETIRSGARLPHPADLLDVQYAALSYETVQDIEYRYRLRGASDEWSTTETYRPISFANLGAGNYVFEVTARKGDGEWQPDMAQFAFRIDPPFWETRWFWLLLALASGLLVWLAMRVKVQQARRNQRALRLLVEERTRELEDANQQLQKAAITDPLTGLYNRRFLGNQILTDVAQVRRMYRSPTIYPNRDIVFLLVDLDHFKQVNDRHGHAAGDYVLKEYAAIIQHEIRESDYVVRWGGEEFLVVARNTDAAQIHLLADRIHRAGQMRRFAPANGIEMQVTCSIGACHLPLFADDADFLGWEQTVEVADAAVYMAKRLGRDGWVSIHGETRGQLADADELMERLRHDFRGLVEEGILSVNGSHDSEQREAVVRLSRSTV